MLSIIVLSTIPSKYTDENSSEKLSRKIQI